MDFCKAIKGSRMTRANVKQKNRRVFSLKNPWLNITAMFSFSVFLLFYCHQKSNIHGFRMLRVEWVSVFFMKSSKNYHAFCPRNPIKEWLNTIKLSYTAFIFVSFNAKMTFIYDSTHNLVYFIRLKTRIFGQIFAITLVVHR